MRKKKLFRIICKEIYKLMEPVLFCLALFLWTLLYKEPAQQGGIPFLNTAIYILCLVGMGISALWVILQIIVSIYDVKQKIELEKIKEEKE